MPRCLSLGVLADDLTGALASAARLREGGWRTVVLWREALPRAQGNAVVVDMRTRDYGADPRQRAAWWARHLWGLGYSWIEVRTDSTLRGNPAAEIEGAVAGLGQGTGVRLLAVPAFPEAGRLVEGGRLRAPVPLPLGSAEVAQCLFGADRPHRLLTEADIDRGPATVVRLVRSVQAAPNDEPACFVADGRNEGHLRVLAEAARDLSSDPVPLVTLSPGAWLRYLTPPPTRSFVLAVISSNTPTNHEQLAVLQETRPTSVLGARQVLSGEAAAFPSVEGCCTPTIVVETISETTSDPALAWVLASLAGRAAGQILDEGVAAGLGCRGVVVGGGQTASALMDVLGAERLVPEGEVLPLCPMAKVVGGPWAGLPVITKGGLVGNPDTLNVLIEELWKEQT